MEIYHCKRKLTRLLLLLLVLFDLSWASATTAQVILEQDVRGGEKQPDYVEETEPGKEYKKEWCPHPIQRPQLRDWMEKRNDSFICFDAWKKMIKYNVKHAGYSIQFFCLVKGNPKPTITWYKDGKLLPSGVNNQFQFRKNYLGIVDLKSENSGTYTCQATNGEKTINHDITLNVIEHRARHLPIFYEIPQNKSALIGSNFIVMNCSSRFMDDGISFTEFFYNHSDFIFDLSNEAYELADSRTKNKTLDRTDDILVLDNVTHKDEGWYSCLVANSLGPINASVYLHIVDELVKPQAENNNIMMTNMTTFVDQVDPTAKSEASVNKGGIGLIGIIILLTFLKSISCSKK